MKKFITLPDLTFEICLILEEYFECILDTDKHEIEFFTFDGQKFAIKIEEKQVKPPRGAD
ncbi:MAG: hypothetical protein K2L42_04970 [Clostridia bacterium]|nr:hypothetical protein [Clostridia bacterium]